MEHCILKEYRESCTIFGKDVVDLADEELDSIPKDILKALIKESLINLNTIKHHQGVTNNKIENLTWCPETGFASK